MRRARRAPRAASGSRARAGSSGCGSARSARRSGVARDRLRREPLVDQLEHLELAVRQMRRVPAGRLRLDRRFVGPVPEQVDVNGPSPFLTAIVETQTCLRPPVPVFTSSRWQLTGQPSPARRAPEQPGWQTSEPRSSTPPTTSQHCFPTRRLRIPVSSSAAGSSSGSSCRRRRRTGVTGAELDRHAGIVFPQGRNGVGVSPIDLRETPRASVSGAGSSARSGPGSPSGSVR